MNVTLGDFTQDAAHDFTGTRFWHAFGKLDFLRRGVRADVGPDGFNNFPFHLVSRRLAGFKGDEGIDRVAFNVVRVADDCSFCNGRMRADRALDLSGAKVVPGNDDDVVDAPGDRIVAVLIA